MSKADKVLKSIEDLSQARFLPIIGSAKAKLLEKMIKKYEPKNVLEIGTLVGYSSIIIAKNMKHGKVTTIEINRDLSKLAESNVREADLSRKINIVVGNAREVIPELEEKYDFLFIDAAKEEYYDYLKLVEKKLTKKAVIVADNVKMFADNMQNYLEYVRKSGKYKSTYHDFGFDAMEVSIKL